MVGFIESEESDLVFPGILVYTFPNQFGRTSPATAGFQVGTNPIAAVSADFGELPWGLSLGSTELAEVRVDDSRVELETATFGTRVKSFWTIRLAILDDRVNGMQCEARIPLSIFFCGICVVASLRGASVPLAAQESATTSRQTAQSQTVTFADGEKGELKYWLYLPKEYQQSADGSEPPPSPLMIFLHGRGECGDDLELVKKWGPPKLVETEAGIEHFPFVLISPQCPSPGWDTGALKQLIDSVVEDHKIDQNRIYLTGLSMGGFATWRLAAEHTNFFAAAIPICGGGNRASADKLTSLPIWAFHGDEDNVVSVSASKTMIEAIEKAGGKNAKLTIYPGVGHNSWSQTYANPEIYQWLLMHRRGKPDDR